MVDNSRIAELIGNSRNKEIAVIGDVMLDRYFWGSVQRVSPEAPVPVVDIEQESFHLGGAANVASNLASLGLTAIMCGVVGDDTSGRQVVELGEKSGMIVDGLIVDARRPTTVKTRIIGNNQHIARLDREVRTTINSDISSRILALLASRTSLAGVILEDYNKGVISSRLIEDVIAFAKEKSLPVFVDPKQKNFFQYKGATVFKPNKKEAQDALETPLRNDDDYLWAGKELLERLECENVLLTLGAKGILLLERNGDVTNVPTMARQVADVSGAGDTTIATLSAMMVAGATVKEATVIANRAAGIVCELPGIVSITAEMLLSELSYETQH